MRLTSIFCLLFVFFNCSTFCQSANEIFEMSKSSFNKGFYNEALVTLNKCIKKDSSQADYFLLRAKIFFKLNKFDAAISDCYSTLSREPDKPEVFFLRGQLCQVTKSYGGAILFFGKTIKFSKSEDLKFEAYLNRGNSYYEMGKYNDAYNDFIFASNIKQEDVRLLYSLAQTYYKLAKTSEARNTLEKLLVLEPDYALAYELSGRISTDLKKYEEALGNFEIFCKMNPAEPRAYYQLSETYLSLKEFDKALYNINTSINLQPTNPYGYKIKGLIYLEQKQVDEGCNNLFKALQMGYLDNVSYDLLDLYLKNCELE
jgi:tetratricopeptide (TPR) repeat protein